MGKPRNTQKYPTYPEIPENTRKKKRYPEIPDRIFQHSYPTRTRPATRYFVQYPTRPDIEKPYPLGTASWPSLSSQLSSMLSLPSWLSTWLVLTARMEKNDHSMVNTTLISSSSTSPACSHPPTLSTYSMPLTSIRLRSRFLCDYNGRIAIAQIIWFQIMIANKKWLYFVFHYMIFGH